MTVSYVPVGIVFKSSRVCIPFNFAKSTVCSPVVTVIGVLVPCATAMPIMSTLNETTLGKGASPPDTKTIPDCCCATGGVLMFPAPHPTAKAIGASANSPLNHFLAFMAFFPFLLKYPGGAPCAHRPLFHQTRRAEFSRFL